MAHPPAVAAPLVSPCPPLIASRPPRPAAMPHALRAHRPCPRHPQRPARAVPPPCCLSLQAAQGTGWSRCTHWGCRRGGPRAALPRPRTAAARAGCTGLGLAGGAAAGSAGGGGVRAAWQQRRCQAEVPSPHRSTPAARQQMAHARTAALRCVLGCARCRRCCQEARAS